MRRNQLARIGNKLTTATKTIPPDTRQLLTGMVLLNTQKLLYDIWTYLLTVEIDAPDEAGKKKVREWRDTITREIEVLQSEHLLLIDPLERVVFH